MIAVAMLKMFLLLRMNFQITSTQVMKTFIRRIKQINPLLNCVVDERYDAALQDAANVDELISSNKYTADQLRELKPFLGVPISTKDCIAVKDMLHTGGLWLRRHIRSPVDSDAIRLMRNAGAIPFALTNVSEVCMWQVKYLGATRIQPVRFNFYIISFFIFYLLSKGGKVRIRFMAEAVIHTTQIGNQFTLSIRKTLD